MTEKKEDRYFYVSYAADSKILSHNGQKNGVYSYVVLGAKNGSYINHGEAIRAIISQGKHINPVILNIIELSKEDFEWFIMDMSKKKGK